MKRLVCLAALVVLAAASRAELPPGPLRDALLAGKSPADVRARLAELARTLETTSAAEAAEAWSLVAQSFERGSERDSAVVHYRRAFELRGEHTDRMRLADALVRRRKEGDLPAAIALLNAGRAMALEEATERVPFYDTRLGWAMVLAGRPDSAVLHFAPHEGRFTASPEWRYRMGRARLELGEYRRAFPILLPLAVASRKQDREVMDLMNQIGDRSGLGARLLSEVDRVLDIHDGAEKTTIEALGGEGVRFVAPDLFPLGGVVVPAAGRGIPRAALVLVAPGDSIQPYDSLAVAIRRAGFSTLLMDVRGSGWSVSPACASPDTWQGREELMQSVVARDVRAGIQALANATRVDTSHVLLVAVGSTAGAAAEAATLLPSVTALAFVSPAFSYVDVGPMRARLAARGLPAFYQLGAEDLVNAELIDALYRAGNLSASRVTETRAIGGGALQFRIDWTAGGRFTTWIREAMTRSAKPREAPRSRSQRG